MGFRRGDRIEVASKEDGFLGSYYAAIVISELVKNEYIVQYRTLVNDDLSAPLREIVSGDNIRPFPPDIPATEFGLCEKVDVFANDGWWVGKISGRIGTKYLVYFDSTGDEIAYPLSKLRVHQDWMNGKWILPRKGH